MQATKGMVNDVTFLPTFAQNAQIDHRVQGTKVRSDWFYHQRDLRDGWYARADQRARRPQMVQTTGTGATQAQVRPSANV